MALAFADMASVGEGFRSSARDERPSVFTLLSIQPGHNAPVDTRGRIKHASTPPYAGLLLLAGVIAACLVVHIKVGSHVNATPKQVLDELLKGDTGEGGFNLVVWQFRLPRALGCALIGALLGAVGSAFQALFRNPLAEPYIVGVSSGAAAGGTAALVLGFAAMWSGLGLLAAAFAGGLLALALVFAIAGRRGLIDVKTLLLAGVVISSMLSALLSMILILGGKDTNVILRWLLGSTDNLLWNQVWIMLATLLVGGAVLLMQTKKLNAFAVSEQSAQQLGIDTERLKLVVLGAGAAMTAVAVGTAGMIGFLGLVAPHIARRLLGVDWRWSLAGSALLGSALLLAADIIAQRVLGEGRELQVGIVTSLIGAPFLLVLLRRS
jgi:iron complex transport system permease protein